MPLSPKLAAWAACCKAHGSIPKKGTPEYDTVRKQYEKAILKMTHKDEPVIKVKKAKVVEPDSEPESPPAKRSKTPAKAPVKAKPVARKAKPAPKCKSCSLSGSESEED